MARKAIVFTQHVRNIPTQQGPVTTQDEVIKVFPLETTLQELWQHAQNCNTRRMAIAFENEDGRNEP